MHIAFSPPPNFCAGAKVIIIIMHVREEGEPGDEAKTDAHIEGRALQILSCVTFEL